MVYEKIEIKYKQPLFYDEFLPLDAQEWYVLYRILKAEIDKIEQLIKPTLPDELRNKSLDEVVKILERKEYMDKIEEGRIEIYTPQKHILDFLRAKDGQATLKEILQHSKHKYKKEEILKALEKLKKSGQIYEPDEELYRLIE